MSTNVSPEDYANITAQYKANEEFHFLFFHVMSQEYCAEAVIS